MTSPEPECGSTGTPLHMIPAAADPIGLGETYIRRLISTGQLQAVVVNGVLRVHAARSTSSSPRSPPPTKSAAPGEDPANPRRNAPRSGRVRGALIDPVLMSQIIPQPKEDPMTNTPSSPTPMFNDPSPSGTEAITLQQFEWNLGFAHEGATALVKASDPGWSVYRALINLVADLHHLSDSEGLEWSSIAGGAERCYRFHSVGEEVVAVARSVTPGAIDEPRDEIDFRRDNKARARNALAVVANHSPSSVPEDGILDVLSDLHFVVDHLPDVIWADVEQLAEIRYLAQVCDVPDAPPSTRTGAGAVEPTDPAQDAD